MKTFTAILLIAIACIIAGCQSDDVMTREIDYAPEPNPVIQKPMKPQSNAQRGTRNAEFSQAVSASPAGRARIHVPAAFAGSAAQQANLGAGTPFAL